MKDYLNIINDAYEKKYAIPHFNFDSLEMAKFILEECEKLKSPLFLAVSMSAVKYLGGFNVVKSIVEALIKDLNITIPVLLHLDHGKDIEECKKAIDAGFNSIMLDLSKKTLEENISGMIELRKYNENILLECEIGSIGENGNQGILYANIEDCKKIMQKTDANLLAPSIGTVHGLYKGEQNINIDVLKNINNEIQKPLVLHGGSDTKDTLIRECIENGISKININTDLKLAWNKGVKEYINLYPNEYDYRKYIKNAEKYIKETIKNKIKLFGSNDRY